MRNCISLALLACLLSACGTVSPTHEEVRVAAAANLTRVMPKLASAFESQGGARVIASYGSTAQLAQQIQNGAPIDVFLAADVEHIEPSKRYIYAHGKLILWAPARTDIHSLADLALPSVKHISVAKPELAPYGKAAVEAIRNAGLWDKLEAKIVYAPSISAAKQLADTGNADAAFTALSLLDPGAKNYLPLDASIPQAAGIVKDSSAARDFMMFLKSAAAKDILRTAGYAGD